MAEFKTRHSFVYTGKNDQLYKCDACGEEIWYVCKLPTHLIKGHGGKNPVNKCTGTLYWIGERMQEE